MSNKNNEDLKTILKAVELTSNWVGPNTASIQSKVVPALLLPKDRTTFYRYEGSLTTPGCQESVIWTVLTEKLTVSESQVTIRKLVCSKIEYKINETFFSNFLLEISFTNIFSTYS